jgi:haloalkane dehalogenase
LHFLQEDHADAIGRSVTGWIAGIEAVRPQLAA